MQNANYDMRLFPCGVVGGSTGEEVALFMAVGKVLFLYCHKNSLFSEAFMQGDQVAAVPRFEMETFFSGPHVN